jgi:hypothetical protein
MHQPREGVHKMREGIPAFYGQIGATPPPPRAKNEAEQKVILFR